MSGKPKPKFYVGEVVMRVHEKAIFCEPVKIENRFFMVGAMENEWLYGGQGIVAWESWLRPLTKRERGPDGC